MTRCMPPTATINSSAMPAAICCHSGTVTDIVKGGGRKDKLFGQGGNDTIQGGRNERPTRRAVMGTTR